MKFKAILENVKKKQGFTNNDQLIEFLKTSKASFYQMQKGKQPLSEEEIIKIMDSTGLEAPEIYGAWLAENAKSKKIRQSWEKFSRVAVTLPFALGVAALALPLKLAENAAAIHIM